MAAEVLAPHWEVHLYEKGKAVGRKFLVAGKGGFNLTNHATGTALESVYHPVDLLHSVLRAFDSQRLREWLAGLGIPTFVGSSGRVFHQRGITPIAVLQAWLRRLQDLEVQFHLQHRFVGLTDDWQAQLQLSDGTVQVPMANYTVFALGGASWSVTGSTGEWLDHFGRRGIPTRPFAPSNCGVEIDWPAALRQHHAGKPLKNIALTAGTYRQAGEASLTDYGLEGNAVYPLIRPLRDHLAQASTAELRLDLKPQNTLGQLHAKIADKAPRNYAKALRLDAAALALVKSSSTKAVFLDPSQLCRHLKNIPLTVRALRPTEEAISTVGGIDPAALHLNFSLRACERIFTIGEMVDWDAPTGGFLLQGCLSMGYSMRQLR